MNATLRAELERIAGTFRKNERLDFLAYIWSTEFADADRLFPTDEAIERANQAENNAAIVWNELHAPA